MIRPMLRKRYDRKRHDHDFVEKQEGQGLQFEEDAKQQKRNQRFSCPSTFSLLRKKGRSSLGAVGQGQCHTC